nr:recombinase family protein [Paracoccus sp. IB05]
MQNPTSCDDQIRLCREHAERMGWSVSAVYGDTAISGSHVILRPGVQRMIQDGRARKFDIVLAEGMERISRGQADIASIYDNMTFAGVKINTLHEGEVTQMLIGFKGTMNSVTLADLSTKTHRGLRGRIEAGKSGGGNAYGYKVLRSLTEDGELKRGDREIIPEEAAVVQRIFHAYLDGESPNKIADMLNREGVSGPRGGKWDKSTIHRNPKRGTGILNNELYIGKLVWNRQKFIKDPQTGKPQARPNPESDWIIKDVPELRIIDQDLWDKVKARQEGRKIEQTEREAWERREPRFLLTGLVKCGCCGGGFSTIGKDRFGCSNSRNKGTSVCPNRTGITRQDLEGRILTILSDRLMDPELVKVFAAEYIAERNRLASTRTDDRAVREKELAKVIKEQDTLVKALAAGLPPERIRASWNSWIPARSSWRRNSPPPLPQDQRSASTRRWQTLITNGSAA